MRELAELLDTTEMREVRARKAAEHLRNALSYYSWVGIYDVGDDAIDLLGHTGVQAPAQVHAPIGEGINADAVRMRTTVVRDSEIAVPILGAETGIVIGTLDVQIERPAHPGVTDVDRGFLERCAQALMPLFE